VLFDSCLSFFFFVSFIGGLVVRLNGPRGWAFDTVTSDSSLVDAKITVINGIDMVVVGIVEATAYEIFMNLFYKQTTLYRERQGKADELPLISCFPIVCSEKENRIHLLRRLSFKLSSFS
jgi:hypothetical protein